ncbi:Protein LEO1-like [Vitis vinifera]|uniref:Protein LEO1-like n=1 Tax=Vitis vinifera TaxID=29760 RepID=A0A438HFV4_VITVI|nr:Protein LEO1-like [Vitis vinifera]
MQRDFLWLRTRKGKKDHLITWDVVCSRKEFGGLEIGKTSLRDCALLKKWLWRFPKESQGLYKVVSMINLTISVILDEHDKVSNTMGIEPKPFDPKMYVEEDTFVTDESGSKKRMRLENNIVRWRNVKNPDGTTSVSEYILFYMPELSSICRYMYV